MFWKESVRNGTVFREMQRRIWSTNTVLRDTKCITEGELFGCSALSLWYSAFISSAQFSFCFQGSYSDDLVGGQESFLSLSKEKFGVIQYISYMYFAKPVVYFQAETS